MSPAPVTVVVAVRNGSNFLTEALDSVSKQTVSGMEVVVVDDGSTDDTVRIASQHPLLPTIVRQPAHSLPAAMNTGVAAAGREFIAFLDHDDVWPVDRIAVMLEALRPDPSAGGVFGQAVNTDDRLRPRMAPVPCRLVTAMLLRREALQAVGEFRTDIHHASNVDWVSRAQHCGVKLLAIAPVVLWRRVHDDNLGVRGRDLARSNMLTVIRDHHRRTRPA